MNKTIIKAKLFAISFLITGNLFAQQKLTKVSQSISVNKDVTINLNTSHCNIIFDTWNKGTVKVEAYIESDDLSDEELQDALKKWTVDIDGSQEMVSISTKGNEPRSWAYTINGDNDAVHAVLEELKFELTDLPEMNFDFHFEMPELPKLPKMPELPKLPKGVKNFHFNYDAYKKDGKKYLEEYTQKFESAYGEDYAAKMEAWGEKFGKEWGEKYAKDMTKWAEKFDGEWGEEYAKKIKEWAERFGAKIEQQAKRTEEQKKHIEQTHKEQEKVHQRLAREKEKHAQKREKLTKKREILIEKLVNKKTNSKVKKTIKIKMPKEAKLKVNVRHGEISFAANVENLKADLSHSKFTAYSVNGSRTSINASYSPIYVTHWHLGELNLNHVKKAQLDNVKQMVLTSNSSNIKIQNLTGNAIIDGSIDDLKILKIDDTFTNLNVILQNSDAIIALPMVDYNLQYKGNRSRFSHPKKHSNENLTSFNSNNSNTDKTIVVNAKYSNVIMQ